MICYNQTGTDIEHIISSANQAVHSSEESQEKMISYLAKVVGQMLYQVENIKIYLQYINC